MDCLGRVSVTISFQFSTQTLRRTSFASLIWRTNKEECKSGPLQCSSFAQWRLNCESCIGQLERRMTDFLTGHRLAHTQSLVAGDSLLQRLSPFHFGQVKVELFCAKVATWRRAEDAHGKWAKHCPKVSTRTVFQLRHTVSGRKAKEKARSVRSVRNV